MSEPKKRGRKPKIKDPLEPVKVPKKRGRKPKKTIENNPEKLLDLLKNNDTEKDKNIILRLPLNKSISAVLNDKNKFKEVRVLYDDHDEEDESDVSDTKSFCKDCTKNEIIIDNLKKRLKIYEKNEHYNPIKRNYNLDINFTKDIKDGSDWYQKWVDKTDIHCWWCCHKFDTIPCILPEKYHKTFFYGSGCFCSYNCAMSYNFDLNDHKVWDRQTLINLIVHKIYGYDNITVHKAHPRQTLKMFGGKMSIENFRENNYNVTKEIKFLLPPLFCTVAAIEEKPIAGFLEDTIGRENNKNGLKLRRTKPLANVDNSLLTLMSPNK